MIGKYNSKEYLVTFIVIWALLVVFNVAVVLWDAHMVFDYSRTLTNRCVSGAFAFIQMAIAIWSTVNMFDFIDRLRNS